MAENKDNNTQRIAPGKYVEMGYDLYTVEDGKETLVHQTDADDPEKIVYGVTEGMIEDLERALLGLEAGGKFDVSVKAGEAFGMRDPERVVELEREIFEVDGKFDSEMVKPGAALPMMTAEGYRITGIVESVDDKMVKMDFNHPLAGKDLRFRGKVLLVRDATEAELHPAGGCCGSGCGSCGDGDCGDQGCGCDSGCSSK